MASTYSRRSFLAGALATGTLSATAIYFSPGGRPTPPAPPITLRLVTGSDSTGARALLFEMWNRANPKAMVVPEYLTGSTADQRATMISRASSGSADVVNLDIIDIPHFQRQQLIAPVALEDPDEFIPNTLVPSGLGNAKAAQYWAAPFNTDVGMIFERGVAPSASDRPTLAEIIDTLPDQSRAFTGQLRPDDLGSAEAFVINVLEHAISRDAGILSPNTGIPVYQLERWTRALEPLRVALSRSRIRPDKNEQESREDFQANSLKYMRNWPVRYRELQQFKDAAALGAQMRLSPLPTGILGGQSLAVSAKSAQQGPAQDLIRFLVSGTAQTILASYGFPPTRKGPYSDGSLNAIIPNLGITRGAVETARPRPIHWNYAEASVTVFNYMRDYLPNMDADLPSKFIEELREKLK